MPIFYKCTTDDKSITTFGIVFYWNGVSHFELGKRTSVYRATNEQAELLAPPKAVLSGMTVLWSRSRSLGNSPTNKDILHAFCLYICSKAVWDVRAREKARGGIIRRAVSENGRRSEKWGLVSELWCQSHRSSLHWTFSTSLLRCGCY